MKRIGALLVSTVLLAGCDRTEPSSIDAPAGPKSRSAEAPPPGEVPGGRSPAQQPASQSLGPGSPLTGAVSALEGDISALQGLVDSLGGEIHAREIVIPLATDTVFDFDQAQIKPPAQANLGSLADLLRQTSGAAQVNGHSDGKGDDAYNLALSKRRADAVVAWLTNAGIAATRLSSAGYGEAQPLAPNTNSDGSDDPQGRARNRRVEVVIQR